MNFGQFFKSYELLVGQVEETFKRVSKEFSGEVRCGLGCSDCCFALFDMSLVESIYIKHQFDQRFAGNDRSKIIERANKADRAVHKIKRKAYKSLENGESEEKIIARMALERVRCPMLDDQDQCLIYDIRPITCRLYGIPTEIGGQAHTCGKSGFTEGHSYPTVKLGAINQQLQDISASLASSIHSRYPKLSEMLVPLSMALLTDYSDEYLGVIRDPRSEE
jgi:Fe-S-cluster containining protein